MLNSNDIDLVSGLHSKMICHTKAYIELKASFLMR